MSEESTTVQAQTEVIQLGDHVTLEWLDEGRIAVFVMKNSTRSAVDAYIDGNLDVIRNWDDSKLFCVMTDASSPDVAVTPYLRERLNEVSDLIKTRELRGFSALVMQRGFMTSIIRLAGNTFLRRAGKLHQRYFLNREQALEWLRKSLELGSPA